MLLACKLVLIIFSVLFIVFIPFSKQSILQSSKLDKLSSEIWCRDKDGGGFNESIKHFSIDIDETDIVCNYDPAKVGYEVCMEKLNDLACKSDTIRKNVTIRSSACQLQPNRKKFVNKKLKDGIINDRFEVEINDKIYITNPQLSKKLSTDVFTEIYGKMYAEKMLSEVSSYNKNIEEDLIWYATFFNKMQSNDDFRLNVNTIKTVLNLYFLVKKSMQLKNYLYLNSQDKSNIEYLERQLQSDTKQLIKEKLKDDLMKDRFEMSSEITEKIYLTSPQLLKVIITEVINDVYGKMDTEKILNIVSSYNKNIEEDIAWYTTIYDKMKSNNDLRLNDNKFGAVLKLYSLVKTTIQLENYPYVISQDKFDIEHLELQLQSDIKKLVKDKFMDGIINDHFEIACVIADKIYIICPQLSKIIIKEVINDIYGIIDTEKILLLVSSYSKNIEEDIAWYSFIFEKMKSSGDLRLNDNTIDPVLKLFVLVKETMNYPNYAKIESTDKYILISLRDQLKADIISFAKEKLKEGILNDNFETASEISDKIYISQSDLSKEIIKEVVNEVYGIVETDKILDLILNHIEQTMEFDSYEKVDYHDKSTLQNLKRELITTTGIPSPQGGGHGQPQAGSPSTPGPGGSKIPGHKGPGGGVGGVRRTRSGYREWKRGDPTIFNALWKSKTPLGIRKQLGNAEVYIMLALAIGLVTVVIGCWLSDNCWSPEPEHVVTVA
ncbi:uncharacterized protein LOC123295945 [Chrysoperla carnea]|uniref:uncharacterized protein LOC123295945 n=1 Tax=Chrysoperla carnea TaxID=189513 RepID=UPI001D09399E|nr:uncharacterized protein LOC123295945 [Chrysoperla carnea]